MKRAAGPACWQAPLTWKPGGATGGAASMKVERATGIEPATFSLGS